MSEQETGKWIPGDEQVVVELRSAVHAGDIEAIKRLLRNDPVLASARLGSKDSGTTTPLHLVTDWPGYFPNGPQVVRLLIGNGADPNARTTSRGSETAGPGDETPLHYAASSDDADVAEALIEGGADIEAPDGSIGTPLDNAVGYGCWHVARLLVARGARPPPASRLARSWSAGRQMLLTLTTGSRCNPLYSLTCARSSAWATATAPDDLRAPARCRHAAQAMVSRAAL